MVKIWKISLKPVAPAYRTSELAGRIWSLCVTKGIAVLGWPIGDLTSMTKLQVSSRTRTDYPDSRISYVTNQLNWFSRGMNLGDIVLAYAGAKTVKGIGLVCGNYKFDSSLINGGLHTLPVRWEKIQDYTENLPWHDTIHLMNISDIDNPSLKADVISLRGLEY